MVNLKLNLILKYILESSKVLINSSLKKCLKIKTKGPPTSSYILVLGPQCRNRSVASVTSMLCYIRQLSAPAMPAFRPSCHAAAAGRHGPIITEGAACHSGQAGGGELSLFPIGMWPARWGKRDTATTCARPAWERKRGKDASGGWETFGASRLPLLAHRYELSSDFDCLGPDQWHGL